MLHMRVSTPTSGRLPSKWKMWPCMHYQIHQSKGQADWVLLSHKHMCSCRAIFTPGMGLLSLLKVDSSEDMLLDKMLTEYEQEVTTAFTILDLLSAFVIVISLVPQDKAVMRARLGSLASRWGGRQSSDILRVTQ